MDTNLLKQRRERGVTLMEVTVSIIAMSFVVSSIMGMLSENARALKAQGDAEKLRTLTETAERYIAAHEDQILASVGGGTLAIPVGRRCNGCAQPPAPAGLPTVQSAGFLPESYIDTNSNQQSHALLIKNTPSGKLDAILTTYGGAGMSDEDIGYVSGLLGAAGGGVFNNAAIGANDEISGVHGGWGDNTSNWSASIGGTDVRPSPGTVQVSMSLADVSGLGIVDEAKFLHRESELDPTLNQMQTAIDMGGNDIVSAQDVYAENLSANADISAGGNISASGNVTATNDVVADRDLHAARDLDVGGNADITNNVEIGGNADIGGALDVEGDISTQNSATIGHQLVVFDDVRAYANLAATLDIFADRDLHAAEDLIVGGDANIDDDIEIGRNLEVRGNSIFGGRVRAHGNIASSRDVFADRDLHAARNLVVGGNADIDDNIDIGGALEVRSDSRFDNKLVVGGHIRGHGNIAASRDVFADRDLHAAQDLIVGGDANIDDNLRARNVFESSDRRLKTDIQDLDGEMLSKLRPRSFTWKEDGTNGLGFIAQEVEKEFPGLVMTDEDTGMKAVKYTNMIAPLVAKAQSTDAQIEELIERIEELEAAR